MEVKSIDRIVKKWQDRVAVSGAEYESGVSTPRVDWATATQAAEPAYKTGVAAAVAENRFGKGVGRAGTAKWQKGAREKGVARWPAGVAVAGPTFQSGFNPFAEALRAKTLSPRRARRDPGNLNRVKEVVDTMIATAKTRGAG